MTSMRSNEYDKQVDLLLDVIPFSLADERFALKGGTAINLFVRDMPRLSVDIDLTYLPIEDRETSLKNINDIMAAMADNIVTLPNVTVDKKITNDTKTISKLTVKRSGVADVKIEPNLVLRGSVYPPVERELCQKAQDQFEKYVSVKCLSDADLYGGKICAALDRQHPRDLFDVKVLFENGGLTDEIRKAFVVYLASHNGTMANLLDPREKELEDVFNQQFAGMALEDVTVEELVSARTELIKNIKEKLTDDEKKFLISIKTGEPDFGILEIKGVEKLPGIRWKLRNIGIMTDEQKKASLDRLYKALG